MERSFATGVCAERGEARVHLGRVVLCVTALLLISGTGRAQNKYRQAPETRAELTGLGGYQFGGNMDFAGGSASFDSGASVGGLVGVQVSREGRVVAGYHYQFSDANIHDAGEDGGTTKIGVGIGYLQFGGELEFGDNPSAVPLVGLTIGASHFTPENDEPTDWFFAGALYGGAKFPLHKHFGLRAQIKLLVNVISNESDYLCVSSRGCVVALDGEAMAQGEFSGGFYLAF